MSEPEAGTQPLVVVGVDGSVQSKQALRWAAAFAKTNAARLEAIIAWQPPVAFGWSTMPYGWEPDTDAMKLLATTVDEAFGSDRPADLSLSVREGYPPAVLLDASRNAYLLVVGSRGRGGFAGLLLGSVSAAVAEHASCPVLVVHGDREPAAK